MVRTRSSEPEATTGATPLRVVHVRYVDTLAGHEAMGHAVGAAVKDQVVRAVGTDPEVRLILRLVATKAGKVLYDEFLAVASATYPKYVAELKGMSRSTGVPSLISVTTWRAPDRSTVSARRLSEQT